MREFISNIDHSTIEYVYSLRSAPLNELFLFFTTLGSASFVLIFSLLLAGYLFARKKRSELVSYLLSIFGTYVTVYVLKISIGRARPAEDIAFYLEESLSFPSAHAAIAAAFYGTLSILLAHRIKNQNGKILVYVLAALLVLIVGFSRIYLGVHYLSDVLAGLIIGTLWLILGVFVSKKMTAR